MHLVQHPVLDSLEDIAVHVLEEEVDVVGVLWLQDRFEGNYIFVGYFGEQSDLPVDSLGIDFVLEGEEYLFDGVDGFCLFALDFPDVAVGPAAQFGEDLEPVLDWLVEVAVLGGFILIGFAAHSILFIIRNGKHLSKRIKEVPNHQSAILLSFTVYSDLPFWGSGINCLLWNGTTIKKKK